MSTTKITAILTARPGKLEDLKALLSTMAGPSRAEPGNLRWDIWQDKADPNRFILDELYKNDAAVAAHRETAHFKAYLNIINDLAERAAFVLDPVQVV